MNLNEATERFSLLAARLQACQDPHTRRELLKEMRIAIAEAEELSKARGDLEEGR